MVLDVHRLFLFLLLFFSLFDALLFINHSCLLSCLSKRKHCRSPKLSFREFAVTPSFLIGRVGGGGGGWGEGGGLSRKARMSGQVYWYNNQRHSPLFIVVGPSVYERIDLKLVRLVLFFHTRSNTFQVLDANRLQDSPFLPSPSEIIVVPFRKLQCGR